MKSKVIFYFFPSLIRRQGTEILQGSWASCNCPIDIAGLIANNKFNKSSGPRSFKSNGVDDEEGGAIGSLVPNLIIWSKLVAPPQSWDHKLQQEILFHLQLFVLSFFYFWRVFLPANCIGIVFRRNIGQKKALNFLNREFLTWSKSTRPPPDHIIYPKNALRTYNKKIYNIWLVYRF